MRRDTEGLGVNFFCQLQPNKAEEWKQKQRAWCHQGKEKVVYRSVLLQERYLLSGVTQNKSTFLFIWLLRTYLKTALFLPAIPHSPFWAFYSNLSTSLLKGGALKFNIKLQVCYMQCRAVTSLSLGTVLLLLEPQYVLSFFSMSYAAIWPHSPWCASLVVSFWETYM